MSVTPSSATDYIKTPKCRGVELDVPFKTEVTRDILPSPVGSDVLFGERLVFLLPDCSLSQEATKQIVQGA